MCSLGCAIASLMNTATVHHIFRWMNFWQLPLLTHCRFRLIAILITLMSSVPPSLSTQSVYVIKLSKSLSYRPRTASLWFPIFIESQM
ncbi:hypothetical protein AHF37_12359 [Paragonimus kellicotti]|nr:hypothetical protein AHF37_12359 [Paragonimus kellicotti]